MKSWIPGSGRKQRGRPRNDHATFAGFSLIRPLRMRDVGNQEAAWERLVAFSPHEEYFASVAPEVRPLLAAIQAKVESLLPDASRCISYNMPAYGAKRVFFYFAAFKRHIGIYPPAKDVALIHELAPYRGEKGNLSIPLDQALPLDLIGRVAVALRREHEH